MDDLRAMTAAADARDARLLEEGRLAELVAAYWPIIVQRCRLRVRDRYDADDVASDVVHRLMHQLARGKRFTVPFRVVVHKRIDWEVKGFFGRRRRARERETSIEALMEPWAEDESLVGILDRDEVEGLVERLPGRDREILEFVYLEGLTIQAAAERLGITRNAADQRLFRARQRLRESLDG
jgi:RNA polymerase sigma-70 factor, ECF subfamily